MKIHFVEKFSEGDADLQLEAMRKHFTFVEPKEAEWIYVASIVHVQKALSLKSTYQKPLAVYCWDYYKWAHEGHTAAAGFNWKAYEQLLAQADVVIVPSAAQQLRLKQLLKIDSIVVPSGVRRFDEEPHDGGYILDPLRYYPDENRDWAIEAAATLNIPIVHSEHGYEEGEWRRLVAGCTFMTSCVREASTGALTLAEGLWMGKASLVSNSPYMGARDYVGDFGFYFQYDDFESLVEKMGAMWRRRVTVPIGPARAWMDRELSYDVMAKRIYETLHRHR